MTQLVPPLEVTPGGPSVPGSREAPAPARLRAAAGGPATGCAGAFVVSALQSLPAASSPFPGPGPGPAKGSGQDTARPGRGRDAGRGGRGALTPASRGAHARAPRSRSRPPAPGTLGSEVSASWPTPSASQGRGETEPRGLGRVGKAPPGAGARLRPPRAPQSPCAHAPSFPLATPSAPALPSPHARRPPSRVPRAGPRRLAPSGPGAASPRGARGGGRGRGLRAPPRPSPAPPRPTPGPPLRLAALPLPSAAGSARSRPARTPQAPRLQGRAAACAPAEGGGATPPRGGGLARTRGPAPPAPARRPGGAGRRSVCGGAPPLRSAARPAPPPPSPFLLLAHPPRAHTPGGRGGAALGAGWGRPGGRGCGRRRGPRAGAADPTPAGRPARRGAEGGGGRERWGAWTRYRSGPRAGPEAGTASPVVAEPPALPGPLQIPPGRRCKPFRKRGLWFLSAAPGPLRRLVARRRPGPPRLCRRRAAGERGRELLTRSHVVPRVRGPHVGVVATPPSSPRPDRGGGCYPGTAGAPRVRPGPRSATSSGGSPCSRTNSKGNQGI